MKTTLLRRGLLAFAMILSVPCPGEQSKDPFADDYVEPIIRKEDLPPRISMTYEVFSLPLTEAAVLQRKDMTDGEFYKELVARASKGDAKQEAILLTMPHSGIAINSRSVSELMAPTMHEAGSIRLDENRPKGQSDLAVPRVHKRFERTTCGIEVRSEASLDETRRIVSFKIESTHTSLAGRTKWGQGLSAFEQPIYRTQRLYMSTNGLIGLPCLVGTVSPTQPPDTKNTPKRVWFAFITPDLAK